VRGGTALARRHVALTDRLDLARPGDIPSTGCAQVPELSTATRKHRHGSVPIPTLALMSSPRRRSADVQRISGPGELLQAVPYLLGFHPSQSLVLIGLHAGRLAVTARLDLRDAERGGVPHALDAMIRGGSSSFVAVVYDDDAVPGDLRLLPWAELAGRIHLEIAEAGADVLDVLLVSCGRWWSFTCTSADCCPADGQELPDTPSAFAAAATYQGVVALPDRTALEAVLAPLPEAERQAMDAALAEAEQAAVRESLAGRGRRWEVSVKRALFKAARASGAAGWAGPGDHVAVRFGAALAVTRVRDAVWMAVDDRRLDGRPLWRELGRRLPSPYDAPALFLFGWAAWRAGDGALAGIAAERAVGSDPHYSAADLLLAAVTSGVDPRRLPRLRMPRSA